MKMTHQNIVALILVTAAVLLLIRQVVRMVAGKTGGCSCAPPKDAPPGKKKTTPNGKPIPGPAGRSALSKKSESDGK